MHTLLQIAFLLNGTSLLYAIWTYVRQRSAGKSVAVYQAGNISGSLGMMLLLAALLEGVPDEAETMLLVVASLLTAWSATLFVRARRRESVK